LTDSDWGHVTTVNYKVHS